MTDSPLVEQLRAAVRASSEPDTIQDFALRVIDGLIAPCCAGVPPHLTAFAADKLAEAMRTAEMKPNEIAIVRANIFNNLKLGRP